FMELGISQQVSVQGSVLLGAKMLTTMAKPGRNDPCPCGSGNKYKRCCLAKHEADARLVAAVARELAAAEAEIADELTTASNAVVDLIHAGELDAAEHAAHDLLACFPDVHDGY